MPKRIDFETYQKEAFRRNPELEAEYERLRPEFETMSKLINARKKAGCSQLELAQRLDMQQPAIARLERGGYTATSISKLARIADALGYSMKVSFVAKKANGSKKTPQKTSKAKVKRT